MINFFWALTLKTTPSEIFFSYSVAETRIITRDLFIFLIEHNSSQDVAQLTNICRKLTLSFNFYQKIELCNFSSRQPLTKQWQQIPRGRKNSILHALSNSSRNNFMKRLSIDRKNIRWITFAQIIIILNNFKRFHTKLSNVMFMKTSKTYERSPKIIFFQTHVNAFQLLYCTLLLCSQNCIYFENFLNLRARLLKL